MAEDTKLLPVAKRRYGQLTGSRETSLRRARQNSKLTIPGLVPDDGQDANASFDQPYQSLGARAVNNLSAWLLVTLFPPDQHFFRFQVHEDTADELGAQSLSEVKAALFKLATKGQNYIEGVAARPIIMECLRHLVVAGNALFYVPLDRKKRGAPRMWRMDQYVVLRDDRGEALEIVIKEKVYAATLSEETRTACKVTIEPGQEDKLQIDLYTHVKRVGEDMVWYQEINEAIVPQSNGKAPSEKAGWMPLRWQAIPGSDWGRSHVSEYAGDLLSLEDLNKAIIQFAAVASRIIHIVDPNAMVDIEELASAETGDYVTGYVDRIKALQLDKSMDFQVASNVAERIELRLSHAFMLQSGTVRNAERVTAEEIRAMAEELENVLGGVYTVLSAEFQLPLIRRIIYILERTDPAFPELPKEIVPTVVTGFEALGRTHSANKLRAWMADMTNIYGPQVVQSVTDPTEVGRRFAESYGIEDIDSLIKSQDQQSADQQNAAAAQTAMAVAPHVAKGAVDAATAPDAGAQ